MRLHYILASLTIATEFAWANNDFFPGVDIEDKELEEELEDSEDEQPIQDDTIELQQEMLGGINDPNYFQSREYQRKTKEGKMKDLWDMLVPFERRKFTKPAPLLWKEQDMFFTHNQNDSFSRVSDDLGSRVKTTHTHGLVAKVQWKMIDNEYSGLYSTGSEHVIMRLSQTVNLTEHSKGLLPAVAFKFLIDGKPSENLFGMPNMTGKDENGETSWDFFHRPMGNRVKRFTDQCELQTVEQSFRFVTAQPYATAISPAGRIHENGRTVKRNDINIPQGLVFTGTKHFPENNNSPWYRKLQSRFKQEDTIMQVHAWTAPEVLDGELVHIADIVLLSDLYAGKGGDTKLFFQHRKVFNTDERLWPREWVRAAQDVKLGRRSQRTNKNRLWPGLSSWPETDKAAEQLFIENEISGCPFAWLLQ